MQHFPRYDFVVNEALNFMIQHGINKFPVDLNLVIPKYFGGDISNTMDVETNWLHAIEIGYAILGHENKSNNIASTLEVECFASNLLAPNFAFLMHRIETPKEAVNFFRLPARIASKKFSEYKSWITGQIHNSSDQLLSNKSLKNRQKKGRSPSETTA